MRDIVLVMLLLAMPAWADDLFGGPACIRDGRTLFVSVRIEQGQCRGGVKVRLYGIDAPDPEQRCATVSGAPYACGLSALNALEDMTFRVTVKCRPRAEQDADRSLPAICWAGERELNGEMVARGWALAHPEEGDEYLSEEAAAKAGKRGLWAGRFDAPWIWRQERRR